MKIKLQPVRLLICMMVLVSISLEDAKAQITVRGTVKDDSGPIPGVNVLIKGAQRGTITSVDGEYQIDAEPEDILIFRSLGYSLQEIRVGDKSRIDVVMETEVSGLDEVIVVGYGTQSKWNVTGSIAKVDMSDTENLPNTNISQALRGRVAGVQFTDNGRPGQNGSILIRGPRSLSASNSPLIILDGIFFNGSLVDINPNDIESIEVLKDASASAIYGSRAANGVILVTSKRGKSEKPRLTINSFAGVSEWSAQTPLLTPERYLEKSQEIRRLRNMPFDPAVPESFLTNSEAANFRNGNIVNPYDEISQNAGIRMVDASLSGNTEYTNYYLSASMSEENGLILNDNLKRVSFRVNVENKITDWLKIGTNTMFSQNDMSGIPASLALTQRQSPFGTWYREDGTPTQFTVPEDQGASGNPLRNQHLSSNLNVRNNLFSNFYAIINVPKIDGLTFRVNYSHNYRWIRDYQATRQDPYLPETNTASASKRNWMASDWVLENILDYRLQLGDDHGFDFTLMYGTNQNTYESTNASADQLETDIFGWNNLDVGTIFLNNSEAQKVTGISSMARINYRLKDKYLVTLTARRDGSSVFAANNKFATFPSMALSWIISDEGFMKESKFVDFLKLRTSYGAVGNQAISPYQSLSRASTTRYVYGDGSNPYLGIFPSGIPNQDLKWETTFIGNIAVDFGLFGGKLSGSVELYDMDTRDLLVQRSLPTMTGYTSIWTNLGRVNNRGIELSLSSINLIRGDFEWSTDLVLSNNINKIVSLYGIDSNGDGREDDDIGNRWFIGQPIDVYYDFQFDGIYQVGDELPPGYQPGFARFKDLNGDGEIDLENDRTIIGQGGQPRVRWGITNNFRYKGLTLSVFINAMQGWLGTFNAMDFYSNSIDPIRPGNMVDYGWWTEENQSQTRPSLEYNRSTLGHNWYLSRNFIRIQDVSLSYDLPSSFLEKFKLSNCNVYISGKNLVTFTDWIGTNPETITDFPMPRSYALGVRLGF